MKQIVTPLVTATLVTDQVVLIDAHEGVEITAEAGLKSNQMIMDALPGDFGFIFNRKADYSIDPVPVYQMLNGLGRVKAIAIVYHRNMTRGMLPLEKDLFNGPLEGFGNVDDAVSWMKRQFAGQAD